MQQDALPEIRFPDTWTPEEVETRGALVCSVLAHCQAAGEPLRELEAVVAFLDSEYGDELIRRQLLSGEPWRVVAALEEAGHRGHDAASLLRLFTDTVPATAPLRRAGS